MEFFGNLTRVRESLATIGAHVERELDTVIIPEIKAAGGVIVLVQPHVAPVFASVVAGLAAARLLASALKSLDPTPTPQETPASPQPVEDGNY